MDILPYQRGSSIAQKHYTTLQHTNINSHSPHAISVCQEKTSLKQTANTSHFVDNQQISDVAEKLRLKNAQTSDSDLGKITKSASKPIFKGLGDDFVILRSKAQLRVKRFLLQDQACKLLPSERINNCLKKRITKDKGVIVKYNPVTKHACYGNLQLCSSVWNCAVCAAKISEKRRSELKKGIAQHRANGGYVYLLTLTNSHHYGDNLALLMSGQKKALKYLWSDRKPKEHFAELGKVGHITANEVTHGKHGWHPHMHILMFFDKAVDIKELQTFIANYWQHCCKKAKLKQPSLEHGCDITDGSFADRYVSKWGLEEEMTKGHIKKGREGGNTPFDLLRLSESGCEESGRLFQQYAAAYKGKRQLFWSNGLKKLLLVEEITDKQAAESEDDDSTEEQELAMEIWRLVLIYNVRGELLKVFELDKFDGGNRFDMLITDLAERYVIDYRDKMMRDADLISVRAEYLEQSNNNQRISNV